MHLSAFDFTLPDDRIALTPAHPRESARLLHVPASGSFADHRVGDLPSLLRAGDVLVVNNTKVIPALLMDTLADTGGKIEILLHRQLAEHRWQVFAKPGRKLRVGTILTFPEGVTAQVEEKCEGGEMVIRIQGSGYRIQNSESPLPIPPPQAGEGTGCSIAPHDPRYLKGEASPPVPSPARRGRDREGVLYPSIEHDAPYQKEHTESRTPNPEPFLQWLSRHGQMPLPPYIRKQRAVDDQDADHYQTAYAKHPGAVAAPTAGLHLTPALLETLKVRGITLAEVTLHVGAGTFQPVKVDNITEHQMHAEWGSLSPETAALLRETKAAGRRIVAVGTTSARILETAATDGEIRPFEGDTRIFMTPGYRFQAVDALLTNFHLPRSTLFMLVAAFSGLERMQAAYQHAIASGYRFYSYGDACLLEGKT
jgi:S-adenosylmethionine:tRNA ribosyltransferase-isomerase